MKKHFFYLAILCFTTISFNAIGQSKTIKSERQMYVRGIAGSTFGDTTPVVITYDFDAKTANFSYSDNFKAKYYDIKSLALTLAFVDKESNAPGIYAETIDKDISSLLFYDDKIEIHYRNGNLSTYLNLASNDKPAKTTVPETKKPIPAAKPKTTK